MNGADPTAVRDRAPAPETTESAETTETAESAESANTAGIAESAESADTAESARKAGPDVSREPALPGAGLEGGPAAPPERTGRTGRTEHTGRTGRTERRAPTPRLRALDGLRLVAALMVACYHYGGRDGDIGTAWGTSPAEQFPTASQYFSYGNLGVQIFFVISGFVICMSGWGRPLRSFFASRTARLFPAYWAAVALVTLVFALPWVAYEAVSPSHALVNMTMLQMPLGAERVLGVCWTLWVELRFYALFALFIVLPGANRQRIVLFCAVWTLAAAMTEATADATAGAADQSWLQVVLMPDYSAYFIGGIGLYLVHRNRRDTAAWGIVVISWLIGQYYAVDRLWHPPNPDFFSNRSSLGIILVVTAGYVAVGLIALGYLRWANWRWLTVAGALTYPFYLVHEHLGWVSVWLLHRTLGLPSAVTLAGTVAAMLLLAWLLHRLVERPLTPRIRKALTTPAQR